MAVSDHARRMNGQVRGIALSGKAGDTLDRIFGEPARRKAESEQLVAEVFEEVYGKPEPDLDHPF